MEKTHLVEIEHSDEFMKVIGDTLNYVDESCERINDINIPKENVMINIFITCIINILMRCVDKENRKEVIIVIAKCMKQRVDRIEKEEEDEM